jgi:hypothetical protein
VVRLVVWDTLTDSKMKLYNHNPLKHYKLMFSVGAYSEVKISASSAVFKDTHFTNCVSYTLFDVWNCSVVICK